MRKWTKTAGLLFAAASAVFADGAVLAQDAAADPFAGGNAPASQPAESAGTSVTDAQVNVSEEGTVEIHVNDANLNEVLRMLSLQLQKNILPSKEVRGTVTANLYDVTVREALDAILKANGFDYREKGNVIYVYTAKEIQEQEKANRVARTEVFRLFYTPAENAAIMIKPVLSAEAVVALTTPATRGIQSDSTDVGGNSHASEDILVVTDYPERLDQVRRVLKEIDRKPQQILVEATIMRATLQDDNELGIDFTALGGVDFTTINNTQPGNWDTPGLSNALSGRILDDVDAGAVLDQGFAAGNVGGSGLKLGLVKNNVALFVTALEGITDTVVMANPKVLVLNKQKGSVHVGSEQGYRTAITTETATADNVKFLETGTRLNFRPYVGDNGNIRMEVQPEDSSGAVNSQGLPNKFVTKVTSNVMVKDGHTIVIGGLFRESNTSTRTQVPGFGSLPIIGGLFGKRKDSTVREEVIILLTPHLIKDEAAYSELSEEQARNGERMRVGMRAGMMWFGRERLAEGHYRDAVKDVERGRRGNALWHLNAALNLNPKFAEASDLKARVQGSEVTAADNSSIRSFVTSAIIRDRAAEGTTTQPAEMTPATGGTTSIQVKPSTTKAQATPATPATPAPAAKGSAKTTDSDDTASSGQPTDAVTTEAETDPLEGGSQE